MKILVPFDGSRYGLCTLQIVASMALAPGSVITILQVVNSGGPLLPFVDVSLDPFKAQEITFEKSKHLTDLTHELALWQPHCRINFKIGFGDVTEGILKAADELESDLIVIAAHDKNVIKRMFLSSVSRSVMIRSERPVLVVKPTLDVTQGRMGSLGYRVLVPIDNSMNSFDTIDWLCNQSWKQGTKFKILNVVSEFKDIFNRHEVTDDLEFVHREWMKVKERTFSMIENHAVRLARVVGMENIEIDVCPGDPKQEILNVEREWRPDIIAMGSHASPGVKRILTKSVSGHVARNSQCAALIVYQHQALPKTRKKRDESVYKPYTSDNYKDMTPRTAGIM